MILRLRVIVSCLYYGILPWWVYEERCHYDGMSYGEHLRLNLRYAWSWLTWRESDRDWWYEKTQRDRI